jgi:hypothetical protein
MAVVLPSTPEYRYSRRKWVGSGDSSGLGTVDSQAGDVTLNAIESINLSSESIINNLVLPRSVGRV